MNLQKLELLGLIDKPFKILKKGTSDIEEVTTLWRSEYKKVYPKYELSKHDPYNDNSCIICGTNDMGKIISSIRLTFDERNGLPDDIFFPGEISEYRRNNKRLMEFGRFINQAGDIRTIKSYYRMVYLISKIENIDFVIMNMKHKDVSLHERLIGAQLISADMGIDNGGKHKMSCMSWEINKTKQRFFKWIGC